MDCAPEFRYHAVCVGLSKDQLAAVSPPNKNSFWLCDECLNEFVQWRKEREEEQQSGSCVHIDQQPPSEPCVLHRDVDELKAKVESIMHIPTSNAKCSPDTIMRHSTPKSSMHFNSGPVPNTSCETSHTPNTSQRLSESTDVNENFALLLTNIDGSVTEEDVQLMVAQCLGACNDECKNVKTLVSRWVDCISLDYVSFKIELSSKWRTTAVFYMATKCQIPGVSKKTMYMEARYSVACFRSV